MWYWELSPRCHVSLKIKEGEVIACDAINSPAEFMMAKKLIGLRVKPNLADLADSNMPIKSLLPS